MAIFDELDQRLSIVPRWVVLRTIQRQSVAEHCFNVERIAVQIAMEWFRIANVKELHEISQLALHHDDEEAITGDIPSPAKEPKSEAEIEEDLKFVAYAIVKLADIMEAYWFLRMEIAMGNQYVAEHAFQTGQRALAYAERLGRREQMAEWLITMATNMESRSYG